MFVLYDETNYAWTRSLDLFTTCVVTDPSLIHNAGRKMNDLNMCQTEKKDHKIFSKYRARLQLLDDHTDSNEYRRLITDIAHNIAGRPS